MCTAGKKNKLEDIYIKDAYNIYKLERNRQEDRRCMKANDKYCIYIYITYAFVYIYAYIYNIHLAARQKAP